MPTELSISTRRLTRSIRHSPVIGEQLAEMYFVAQRMRDAVTEAQEILRRDRRICRRGGCWREFIFAAWGFVAIG